MARRSPGHPSRHALEEMESLKADIDKGMTDLAEGRVKDFDAAGIIKRGRKLLAAR
jgi:antitoxin ParD1/3/4